MTVVDWQEPGSEDAAALLPLVWQRTRCSVAVYLLGYVAAVSQGGGQKSRTGRSRA